MERASGTFTRSRQRRRRTAKVGYPALRPPRGRKERDQWNGHIS